MLSPEQSVSRWSSRGWSAPQWTDSTVAVASNSLHSIGGSPVQDTRDGAGHIQKQDHLQSNGDATDRSTFVIVATISGLMLLLLLSLLSLGLYRYRSRDAGSYKIDSNDYTLYEAYKSEGNAAIYRLKTLKSKNRTRKKTIKEWYV